MPVTSLSTDTPQRNRKVRGTACFKCYTIRCWHILELQVSERLLHPSCHWEVTHHKDTEKWESNACLKRCIIKCWHITEMQESEIAPPVTSLSADTPPTHKELRPCTTSMPVLASCHWLPTHHRDTEKSETALPILVSCHWELKCHKDTEKWETVLPVTEH